MGSVPFPQWFPSVTGQRWRSGDPGYVGRHRLTDRLAPQEQQALRRARRRQRLRRWGVIQ